MQARVRKVGVVLVAAPLIFGCHHDRDRAEVHSAGLVARDSMRALGPDDIRIVSTDSTIEMAIIGDSIVTGLAEKALAKVKAQTDTNAVSGTGFGANLEKFVKSTVQTALNKQVAFPVSSISDVRYTRGRLEFIDIRGHREASFGGSDSNSTSNKSMFADADAKAFIKVFKARKGP